MKNLYFPFFTLLLIALGFYATAQTSSYTTVGTYTYVVPGGCNSVTIDMAGGQGGASYYGYSGGQGGRVQCNLAVTPGTHLTVDVAGSGNNNPYYCCNTEPGGLNGSSGSATGGSSGYYGAGDGGGSSDICIGGTSLSNRVIVAAGGGGGSFGCGDPGGAGGGTTGGNGTYCGSYYNCYAGGGATQFGGGTGSCACYGSLGAGGCGNYFGGGGGGGYYGGGGGYYGSGGGGSSYANTSFCSSISYVSGFQSGNGYVNITPDIPAVSASPTPLSFGGVTTNTTSVPPLFFAMNGQFLTGTVITITPPGLGYSISLNGTTWSTTAITYTYVGSSFSNVNVYVRFSPTSSGTASGNITITGGGIPSPVNVPVSGTGTNACSGAPTAGTASVTNSLGGSTGGPATLLTLGLTGTSSAGGLTYQWQSSATGTVGSFSNITGAITPTYSFVGIPATRYYQCVVTCPTGSSATSSTATATYQALATACTPNFANGCSSYGMWTAIASLTGTGGTLADPSPTSCVGISNGNSYDDNTGLSTTTTLNAGTSYTATLSVSSNYYYYFGVQIWIDFNDDGTFQTTESVGGLSSVSSPSPLCTITIPAGAAHGTHRMRIAGNYQCCGNTNYPSMNPCPTTSTTYGDVRDYKVSIVSATPTVPACSGTPVIGITASAPTSSCSTFSPGVFAVGEAIANTGVTYQWQSSTTSPTTGFSNIPGATTENYVPTISSVGPVFYRQVVSCGASSATSIATTDTFLAPPNAITGTLSTCPNGTSLLSSTTPGGVWSSSNTNVTIGSSSGFVTAGVTGGTTATISYTLPTGCFAAAVFTVNPVPATITGTMVVCPASNVTLSDASSGGVWTSSNTGFATIGSSNGFVTGIAGGNPVITYTLPTTCFTTTTITVNATAPITGTFSICTGFTSTFSDAIGGGTWSSSAPATISIGSSSGIANGLAVGSANISYTFLNGCVVTQGAGVVSTPSTYTITGGGSFCTGGAGVHIGVNNSNPGVSYQLVSGGIAYGPNVLSLSGGPVNLGLVNTAGIYTVVANYGSPCAVTMSGSVSVIALPLPTAYSVTGGGGYCSGGTGVSIGLSGSNTGISYQLSNGVPVGASHSGTGTIVNFGLVTGVGTYSVVATNNVTGCSSTMSGTAIVSVNALPTPYTVTGGGGYCAGGTGIAIGLSNSTTGVNYQLYKGSTPFGSVVPGSTGSAITFGLQTVAGIYTVIGTNTATGCSGNMSGSATITVNPTPTAYAVTGGGSFCTGGTGLHVGLGGSTSGVTYTLYLAGVSTGVSVTGTGGAVDFGAFTGTGVYTVVASNGGCTGNMVGSATISTNPVPGLFNVTGGGAYCVGGTGVHVGLSGSARGVSYQLYNSGSTVVGGASGTTAPLDFGLETLGGTYTVVATITGTGCTSTMTGSVNVTVNSLPATFSITGGGSYCAGGSGVNIGLNGSVLGTNYQLLLGGIPLGSATSGTGSSFSYGAYTAPGIYTVAAINTSTGCTAAMTGSATVSINPLPATHNVTGGGGYCSGGTGLHVGLNGSDIGNSYQLLNTGVPVGSAMPGTGRVLDFGLQTASGIYVVTATTPAGCNRSMPGRAVITANPLPTPYPVGGGGNYCFGGSGVAVTLGTSATGVSYQLYRGSTAVGSPVAGTGGLLNFGLQTVSGTYTVQATNVSTGCSGSMSGSAVVNAIPLPAVFTVTGGGVYCTGGAGAHVGLSNSATGVNYQLYNGSAMVGTSVAGIGTGIDFGPQTLGGTYTVIATDGTTGCTNVMSGSTSIAVTVNPLPATFNVTGGGAYCSGGPGQHIGLAASAAGVSYQLYNGSGGVGASMTGTGGALDFGTQTIGGAYTVTGTNTSTGCASNMTGSVVVSVNPLPVAHNVTGGGTYCVGGTGVNIGIDGTNTGASYQLYLGSTAAGSPMTGSGPAINFGLQTTAGTYTVKATNTATGCATNMTGTAIVNVTAAPNIYNVTGGGSYCTSTTGVMVGLSNSDLGLHYQLYNGGPVGAPVTGTGTAISFGLQTLAGTYTVVASGSSLTCVSAMNGSAMVSINPPPAIHNVTGGGSYCAGSTGVSIGLDTSDAGINYQLYNVMAMGSVVGGTGSLLSFGPQTAAGTYTVQATDATTGCTSTMNGSASVAVNALPASYSMSGGGSYCNGGTGTDIELSGSQVGINYQLYNGSATVGTPVPGSGGHIDFGLMPAGVYTVSATNPGTFCANNMNGNATVIVNALPGSYVVTGGGGYCAGGTGVDVQLAGSASGISYQLYNGGTASGAAITGTGAIIDFGLKTANGIYTVEATNLSTGCVNMMSGLVSVATNPQPAVYAVTASGTGYCAGGTGITVSLAGSDAGVQYQLYNGRTATGSAVTGAGGPISFGPQMVAGNYTVVATNTSTGCVQNMSGGATVVVGAAPAAFTVTGGGAYCSGGAGVHVSLSGSASGILYQLYQGGITVGSPMTGSGSILDFGLQTTSGNYTVVASNPVSGCSTNMTGSASVGIDPLPASYSVVGGGSYCSGGSGIYVALSNSAVGIRYQLRLGSANIGGPLSGTGLVLGFGYQASAGNYTVVATNPITGCSNTMAGGATVIVNPLPTAYPITGGGNYCSGGTGVAVGLRNSDAGTKYQLYDGSSVSGGVMNGTGAAINFGLKTSAGTYTVLATDTTTGCVGSMAGSTSIGINALPAVYSVTGGGSYCAGGNGVHIGISNSAMGIDYTLQSGGSFGAVSGTGSALDFGLQTNAGIYTVTATNTATSCSANMSGSATVTIDTVVIPSVNITSARGDTGCSNHMSSFTAVILNGGVSPVYQWSVNGIPNGSGANTFSYLPADGDVVSVNLISDAVCATPSSVTDQMHMTVINSQSPGVQIGSDPGDEVCQGTVVTFNAIPSFGGSTPSYTWFKNSVADTSDMQGSYSYSPSDGDNVYCVLHSSYQCPIFDTALSNTIHMKADASQTPTVVITASNGGNITAGTQEILTATVTNAGPSPTYQWYVNNIAVPGATLPVFESKDFADLDNVSCTVTSDGVCSGVTGSASITIHVNVGVPQVSMAKDDIKLVPNPNNGTFSVKGSLGVTNDEDVTIEITDMLGQIVYNNKVTARNGEINELIRLNSTLSNGMYTLNLHSDAVSKVFHVVIEQ